MVLAVLSTLLLVSWHTDAALTLSSELTGICLFQSWTAYSHCWGSSTAMSCMHIVYLWTISWGCKLTHSHEGKRNSVDAAHISFVWPTGSQVCCNLSGICSVIRRCSCFDTPVSASDCIIFRSTYSSHGIWANLPEGSGNPACIWRCRTANILTHRLWRSTRYTHRGIVTKYHVPLKDP